jgi:hypothetical protein
MSGTQDPAPDRPTLFDRRSFRRLRAMAINAQGQMPAAPVGPLGFVICGIEHSGTTMVSDLFRQVPGVGSGFETGILLADTPADFAGVATHFKWFRDSWGLSAEDVTALCASPDFGQFYTQLAARARILPPGTHTIFDKTPRYLVALKDCLGRVSAPFIATYKDPRAQLHSDWVRAGRPEAMAWLDAVTAEKRGYLLALYEQYQMHRMERRVFFCALEALCLRTARTCTAMFEHAGLHFHPRYLAFRNLHYANTRGTSISAAIPFTYLHEWTPDIIREVEIRFAALDEWFYA